LADRRIEPEKKSLAARLLLPSLILVLAVFGLQLAIKMQENKLSEIAARNQTAVEKPLREERKLPQLVGGESPREAVLQLISELKSSQDPTKVLNHIWWEATFQKLTPYQREGFDIRSPSELYFYYLDLFTNPGAAFLHRLELDAKKQPAESRDKTLAFIKTQRERSGKPKPFTDLSKKLIEIKGEKSDKSQAELELVFTEGGSTTRQKLRLVNVQERWYLDCIQIVPDPLSLCAPSSS